MIFQNIAFPRYVVSSSRACTIVTTSNLLVASTQAAAKLRACPCLKGGIEGRPLRLGFPDHYCEFLAFFAAKSWRRKENFPFALAENSTMESLLAIGSSPVSGAGDGVGGDGSVSRYSLSIRII